MLTRFASSSEELRRQVSTRARLEVSRVASSLFGRFYSSVSARSVNSSTLWVCNCDFWLHGWETDASEEALGLTFRSRVSVSCLIPRLAFGDCLAVACNQRKMQFENDWKSITSQRLCVGPTAYFDDLARQVSTSFTKFDHYFRCGLRSSLVGMKIFVLSFRSRAYFSFRKVICIL